MATKQELIELLAEARASITDTRALKFKSMYPSWSAGIAVTEGQRYQYGGKLYKCVQAHTTQADWTPDITPAMWTVIDEEHTGTIDDPIPAVANMEYTKGLYYIEDGVIYLMNRQGMADGEKITLAYLPSQLVGHYFEVV